MKTKLYIALGLGSLLGGYLLLNKKPKSVSDVSENANKDSQAENASETGDSNENTDAETTNGLNSQTDDTGLSNSDNNGNTVDVTLDDLVNVPDKTTGSTKETMESNQRDAYTQNVLNPVEYLKEKYKNSSVESERIAHEKAVEEYENEDRGSDREWWA